MADHELSERLVLRDKAGCLGLLGLAFVAGGSFVFALLLGAGTGEQPTGWVRALAALIATAHLGAGTWLFLSTPVVSVRLRRDRPVLQLNKRWLFWRRARTIALTEIAHFQIGQGEDSDGHPVYRLELRLRSGERVRLHSVDEHFRNDIDAATEQLRVWSGGRLAARAGSPIEPM